MTPDRSRIDALDRLLPQTQCTRCGYADCRGYAEGILIDTAPINQCPPGGTEGIARLAALTGRPPLPLNPDNGLEGPRQLAVIDEAWCIGCTLCLRACPVDCIVGGPKQMHAVIADLCTGCELCLPVCPVDCISLTPVNGARTGWQAWTQSQADASRARYAAHQARLADDARTSSADAHDSVPSGVDDVEQATADASQRRQATIEAVLARARAARARP